MPYLNVNTNLPVSDSEQQDWLEEATNFISRVVDIPTDYVMTQLQASQKISFAGTHDPCAFVSLRAIGLNEAKSQTLSRELCAFLEDTLKIPAERTFIEFSNTPRHLWGWNSKTL